MAMLLEFDALYFYKAFFDYKKLKKMNVDWDTAVIGLVLTLICVFPFAMMHINNVKRRNRMLHILNESAKQLNCKIGQHEFCGDFVLAMDENTRFVFITKQIEEQENTHFIDLREVQKCEVIVKSRMSKNGGAGSAFIERIELGYVSNKKGKADQRFELFDEALNTNLSGELQLAEEWAKRINECLSIRIRQYVQPAV